MGDFMKLTKEQIQLIADSLPGNAAIYRFDGKQAEMLYMTHTLADLNNMSWSEYQNLNKTDSMAIVFPEDIPKILDAARRNSNPGDTFDLYFRVHHKIRVVDWVHAYYRVIGEIDNAAIYTAIFTNASVEQNDLCQVLSAQEWLVKTIKQLSGAGSADSRINRMLHDIGKYFQADRTYIFRIDGAIGSNIYEWCRPGIEAQIDKLQNISIHYIDSWLPAFKRGQCLIVPNIEKIKTLYPDEYSIMKMQGIYSYLEAPLMVNDQLRGFIGVDNPALDGTLHLDELLLSLAYSIADELVKTKAAKELQASQRRYELAIDGAELAIWEYHIKSRRMYSSSERIRKYNVPSSFSIPDEFIPYFIGNDGSRVQNFFERMNSGESFVTDEFWLQWSPSAPRVCERVFFSILYDDHGNPDIAYGVSMDVTPQKLQMEKYAQSMSLLLAVNPEALGILHFNLSKNSFIEHYGMTETTKAILKAQSFDAFVNNVMQHIVYPEQQKKYLALASRTALLNAFAAGRTARSIDIYRYDGQNKNIWIRIFYNLLENPNTRDIEGVVYSLDISREKQRDEIFRIITSQEYDLISLIHLDTDQYETVHMNPSLPQAIRKALPPEGQQRNFHEFCMEAISQWLDPTYRDMYLKFADYQTITHQLSQNNHYEFTILGHFPDVPSKRMYRKYQHYYLNNEKNTILVIQSDVTNWFLEKQNELQEEQKLRRQAVAANIAKTEFLSRMSHDIRTPLNGIMGMAYIASKETNPSKTAECLKNINISSQFLLGLVNDVLDMSKAESGKIILQPEPYTCEEFTEYLQAVIGRLCEEKGLHFHMEIPTKVLDAAPLMDKLRINQIYFNLMSNAIKFTPPNGTITFRIRWHKVGGKRLWIETTVSDTGVGISKHFQKEMFQPFSQELRNDTADNRGSGLGLSIVKRLVDLMGGTINVTSDIDQGTTFVVTIEYDCVPIKSLQPVPLKEDTADDAILANKHILLCEDHPMNQDIAKTILMTKGMIVETANDGQQGVNIFTASSVNHFDAILMDIRMPLLDGYATTKAIRALPRDDAATIPILAMTADAFPEDVKKCFASGMNGHISKPINPTALFTALANTIAKKR